MLKLVRKVDDRILLAICCIGLWALQMQRPLNPDVAWLLDAGARWFEGQQLYVDIIELNPPLIFYDMVLLSAGSWSKAGYLAGICAAIFVSSLWCNRRWLAFGSMTVPALIVFGQRDHLALIAVLPYLVRERRSWPLGVWLFAGTALKPHLLLIPIFGALWRRQWDSALTALVALLLLYAALIVIAHPEYLTAIVPLGRATYAALGERFGFWYHIALILLVAATNYRAPLAGGILGALLSYVLQGKFWYYQLVPAIGLAIYLGFTASHLKRVNLACAAALSLMSVAYFLRPPRPLDPIPAGARRVLFLTPHIPMAYPVVFERGVENTSPYAALWPVPGAARRPDILEETRRKQVDAIVRRCPEYIFTNVKDRIDYFEFLKVDPRFRGYSFVGRNQSFRVYRNPKCG